MTSAGTSMRYGATRLEVPSGFENILWLISQEVMREHPDDLLQFISDFLKDILQIRERTSLDPVGKNGVLPQVQAEYAQLRESQVVSADPGP